MAAVIGAVGAVGAAVVTALIAQRTGPIGEYSSSMVPMPPAPVTWATIARRTLGIFLVGSGIGLLSAGAAIYGADLKTTTDGPVIGAAFIGWGSGFLAAGVLTILYRRLP